MNNEIFFFFYNLAHRALWLDTLIIFLALYLPYIATISAFIFLLFHHEVLKSKNPVLALVQKKKEVFVSFFAGALAWVLAHMIKLLFLTQRPFEVLSDVTSLFPKTDHSFPSGHATFFMALAVSIFFSHKKAGYVFMILALVIGVSRIASGVHFPADILGGFILGTMVAYFMKNV